MDAYLFLAASLVPLAVGPLIARWAERSDTATTTLDAFVAVTVGGISLLHVLPHAYGQAGAQALLALALGFVLPLGLGHHHGKTPSKTRPAVIFIAFLGLGIHATLDGLALFGPQAEGIEAHAEATPGSAYDHVGADEPAGHEEGAEGHGHGHGLEHQHASASLLAAAVILHRLPMALAIWWIAVPSLGRRIAMGFLVAIAGATLAGFALGGRLSGLLSASGLGLLQAAIAGMLLHMVLGHHEHHSDEPPSRRSRLVSTLGVAAGVALVAVLTSLHPFEHALPNALSTEDTFLTLALAAAPALVLSYLAVALVYCFAPPGLRALWLTSPRRETPDGLRQTPMIECARLVLRPELQLPALALSWSLLGPWMSLWRLAGILGIAGLALLSIKALIDADEPSERPAGDEARPDEVPEILETRLVKRSLADGLRFGFGLASDRTLPWILLGLGVAAFLEPMASFEGTLAARVPAQLALLALLGVPFYLFGLGATPVVAVLAHKGFQLDGLLMFLAAGVAAAGGQRLKASFGRRVAWGFSVRIFVLALVASYALSFPVTVPDLHATAVRDPGAIAWISACILLALTVVSLYRQGFRRFLRPSAAMEKWHGAGL